MMQNPTDLTLDNYALMQAARTGNSDQLNELLNKGIDIESCDARGATPLYLAVENNHCAIVKQLLAAGAKTDARLKNGATPLHIAAISGFKDSIALLLEHGADVQAVMQGGQTPLHSAAFWGQTGVASLLLKQGADANSQNRQSKTPFTIAKSNNDWAFVYELLKVQKPLNLSQENSIACLIGAASAGQDNLLEFLLSEGVDVNSILLDGSTPLHAACAGGDAETICLLVEAGANIEAQDQGGVAPLHVAVEHNHLHVTTLLLQQGANIESSIKGGQRALHIAAYKGFADMVGLLLSEGAQIEAVSDKGESPLYIASKWRRTDAVQSLLAHKANIQAKTQLGETAFDVALADKQGNAVLQLLAGPPLFRVWRGKKTPPDQTPIYTPIAKKEKGCAPGFIAKSPSGANFMVKLGLPERTLHVSGTLLSRKRDKCLSELTAVREKIAADLYALLGHGRFYVAKHRLAIMNIINAFTKDNFLVQGLEGLFNDGKLATDQIKTCTHLLSKWVKGYQDLADLQNCLAAPDTKIGAAFMDFITDHGAVPEWVCIEGQVVPLLGVMEVLAASRLLGDTDVLGGSGKNAGFVIERDDKKIPTAVRVVKIDAGEAFGFDNPTNQLFQSFNPTTANPLKDKRDMQVGNNLPKQVKWDQLSTLQQQTFLSALKQGIGTLRKPGFLPLLIQRRGLFDKVRATVKRLITDTMIQELIKGFDDYLKIQERPDVYGKDLQTSRSTLDPHPIPFNPKAFGVANYSPALMDVLLETPHAGGGGNKLGMD